MLTLSQPLTFTHPACVPRFHASSNHYGLALRVQGRPTNAGKHWTWPGTPPHDTRMHRYASLTGPQKAAWDALAAAMNNDHSTHGITTYTGPIAYMQTNLYRRLRGLPYTDDAPTPSATVPDRVADYNTGPPRQSPILLDLTP
jgi:hypothetical protein